IPEGCQIVDTPGLFGDKKGADEEGGMVVLSDITKKFISEANMILYVVSAKNPIKDTHKECIRWILKDLNKLSSTVFVINRMDDVADLTDEEDFKLQARIKTENIRKKLLECGLSQSESAEVSIVCISADPGGRGIDEWKEHRDEYLRRSHLSALEKTTNSIIQNSGKQLIAKTGCDILNDELNKSVSSIREQERIISEILLPQKEESFKRNQKDLDALRKRIIRSKLDMKKDLKALNKSKISRLRAASVDTFNDFMEDEIGVVKGNEGYMLNDDINNIFMEYSEKNSELIITQSKKFQAEYERQDRTVNTLLKLGAEGAANGLRAAGNLGVNAIKSGIFAGRELLGKIGIIIKFKPWQVTKMAGFATKALPAIGAAIDIVSNVVEIVSAQKKIKKFEDAKNNLKEVINGFFLEIYKKLDSDEKYIDDFAPQYRILEQQVEQDKKDIETLKENLKSFADWEKHFHEIGFSEN
ncbi:MAG: hypothetical protein K2K41_02560, partial [Ruminiclostridium sp.]|nr:hypothetical protein [Ruminiclostridium sp.]